MSRSPGMQAYRQIETIWGMESAKIIAALTRMLRDVALAEDFAHDALVAALERWQDTGIPDNPGAWLMMTAKRRAIDYLRRIRLRDRKYTEVARNTDWHTEVHELYTGEDTIEDDLLRLIFMTCHPILSREARVALTLRLLCGLTTEEIARSFLSAESAVAQRIVRAKRTLKEKDVPFEVPEGDELQERLATVLEVIYLMFNEGYSATSGKEWVRPLLCQEALRLGRMLAAIAPGEPEAHGLVALMELQSSRLKTRVGRDGQPILLMDQNRAQWDHLLIRRGLAALERSRAISRTPGPYALQAAISACHAQAPTASETNWPRIAALYEALALTAPSPVVELNRAVAIAMAFGPAFGLQIIDNLEEQSSLDGYHLLPSVRGDMLARLGRHEEARIAFQYAASLTRNERERTLLLSRAEECEWEASR